MVRLNVDAEWYLRSSSGDGGDSEFCVYGPAVFVLFCHRLVSDDLCAVPSLPSRLSSFVECDSQKCAAEHAVSSWRKFRVAITTSLK